MKKGDRIISLSNQVCDVYDPNCPLVMYAQIEEEMEGEICFFIDKDEIVADFYGISVIIDVEDFFNGAFSLTKDKSKLTLILPNIAKLRQ